MNDLVQFQHDLKNQRKQLSSMLPPGMDVDKFCRTTVNGICTHSQSDRLLSADRQSLFNACQKAAGDGLMLDSREATLVVFHDSNNNRDVVSYIPMVQGLVKLARNSGDIRNIVAQVVFDQDEFEYFPGINDQPIHKPDWFGDRGDPIGAYAVVTTSEFEKIVSIMKKDRILAIGHGGHNAKQYIPGTGAHYEEWWKKTVIKNVLKLSPKSTHLQSALDADNALTEPDRIPPVETAGTDRLRDRISTEKQSPPARTEALPAGGQGVAGTESTHTEHTHTGVDATERLRSKLHSQNQVPLAEPTQKDQDTLAMAIDSLRSCQTLDELKQCGRELDNMVHPDFKGELVGVFREVRQGFSGSVVGDGNE